MAFTGLLAVMRAYPCKKVSAHESVYICAVNEDQNLRFLAGLLEEEYEREFLFSGRINEKLLRDIG